jgi:hypothetical protein
MSNFYRLEFNVEQQCFHFGDKSNIPNTNGYFTVSDYITEREFIVFECFLKRDFKKKYSQDYILKSMSQLSIFWEELINNNLNIN